MRGELNCAIDRKEVIMLDGFVIAKVMPGELNAMVKTIMDQMEITDANEAVRRVNSHEWVVSQKVSLWEGQENVIDLGVLTSNGTTGVEWINRLEAKSFKVNDYVAKKVLRSEDFRPTYGVSYHIVVLKGELWKNSDRITKNIHIKAKSIKLEKPNVEVACLIRERFTDEEIKAFGLSALIVMHESIRDPRGDLFLGVHCYGKGHYLDAIFGDPDSEFDGRDGFVFITSIQP